MTIGAGRRRHKLVIQSLDVGPTADGGTTGETAAPRTVTAVFGEIRPLSGREAWLARAQQDTSTHRITIPYVAGITPAMQAVYRGRTFNFTSINNVGEQDRELVIMATEVVS